MQIDPSELLFAVALFLLLYGTGVVGLRATAPNRAIASFEARLLLIAMVIRFAASIAFYAGGLVEIFRDEDAGGWWGGVTLYRQWQSQNLSFFDLPNEIWTAFMNPLGNFGYYYLLGTLFFVIDMHSRLAAAVLNNFFGALTVVLAYRIGGILFSDWVARRVGWWACLMPSLVMWSAQTLKEPIVIFLETGAMYCCLRMKVSRRRLLPLVGCAFYVFVLVAFRFYAAYLAGAAVILALLMPVLNRGRSTWVSGLIVGGALVAILVGSGLMARHEVVFEKYSLAQLQSMRDYTARNTGSGVVLDYDLRTVSGFLSSAFVGWAHLLLAPFPWQLGTASLRMLLVLPDAAVWWWLFFLGIIPGFRIALRSRFAEIQPILFFLLGLGTLYSITFSNVGLVYRYRAQLMPWLLIFAMVGLEQRRVTAWARRRAQTLPRVPARRSGAPAPGGVPT
jgi:hypothetical protein